MLSPHLAELYGFEAHAIFQAENATVIDFLTILCSS
jgi:hypothetical protein